MSDRPYELRGSTYGYWFEVNEKLGGIISAEVALELHKEPDARTFDTPLLQTVMPYLRRIAKRRHFALT